MNEETDHADAAETVDAAVAMDTVDAAGTADVINAADAIDAADSDDSADAIDAADAADSADAAGSVDAADAIDAADAAGLVDRADAADVQSAGRAGADHIDSNYVWQSRIWRVVKDFDVATMFPYAAAVGIEFNVAFPRQQKIPVELLNNGIMVDLLGFVKAVHKAACLFFFDVLQFNFDLDMDWDNPRCLTYARKAYSAAKGLRRHHSSSQRSLEKLYSVFRLPEVSPERTETSAEHNNSLFMAGTMPAYDDRIGDPFLVRKVGSKKRQQLSMDRFPLCRELGVTLVLRGAKAPPQKLNSALLTNRTVLEIVNFVYIMSGLEKGKENLQMLQELILHNFGPVFEPIYLNVEVKSIISKKYSTPHSSYAAFFETPFKFMQKSTRIKRRTELEDLVENHPAEKKMKQWCYDSSPDQSESYMCPVDFESSLPQSVLLEGVKSENLEVDIEFPQSTHQTMHWGSPEVHPSCSRMYSPSTSPELPISEIFTGDDLTMKQKSVTQREWAHRGKRVTEILHYGNEGNYFLSHSRKIKLDFNVASVCVRKLDKKYLTNHTLFETYKFCSKLSRNMNNFLRDLLERHFDYTFPENFQSYLNGKERGLLNQELTEELLNTRVQFLEVYASREIANAHKKPAILGAGLDDEFPHCRRIGVNLWSLTGPPGEKLALKTLTNGALLEFFAFSRRLCSSSERLMRELLEHNFHVRMRDEASEEARGLHRWLILNRITLKKPSVSMRQNPWRYDTVDLKVYGKLAKRTGPEVELESPSPPKAKEILTYDTCKEIGLDLNLSHKAPTKRKLELSVLTRGALFEVHRYVRAKCKRYVPTLYEILDYNFDLSSQGHRRVEFAWAVASQVLAMVRKSARGEDYMKRVFVLPFECEEPTAVCKQEEEETTGTTGITGTTGTTGTESGDEVVFVRRLVPVDIDVEID